MACSLSVWRYSIYLLSSYYYKLLYWKYIILASTLSQSGARRTNLCKQGVVALFSYIHGFPLQLFFSSAIPALFFLFLFSTHGFPSPPLSTSPAPQYLCPFVCIIFFHLFIEAVSSVSFFSIFFINRCIYCFSASLIPIMVGYCRCTLFPNSVQ